MNSDITNIVSTIAIISFIGVIIGQLASANATRHNTDSQIRQTQFEQYLQHIRQTLDTLIDLRAQLQYLQTFSQHGQLNQDEQMAYGRASSILRSIPDSQTHDLADVIMKQKLDSSKEGQNPKLEALDEGIARLGNILWVTYDIGKGAGLMYRIKYPTQRTE